MMLQAVALEIFFWIFAINIQRTRYGEPLVVSCERTVRTGGGLVKHVGVLPVREWIAGFHYSHETRPPQGLGPGTGHHQGRGRRQRATANDRKPGLLIASIQDFSFGFDNTGPVDLQ
ncbi:MAG: hypothetical protein LC660_03090 [Desulfobacteraceae bacterium]|nr:hypothetical protein [Desulfobacteraceae bacterium]